VRLGEKSVAGASGGPPLRSKGSAIGCMCPPAPAEEAPSGGGVVGTAGAAPIGVSAAASTAPSRSVAGPAGGSDSQPT
jgi:hypothetical protein